MFTALGLTTDANDLYQMMLDHPDHGVAELAEVLDWNEHRVRAAIDQLADSSLLQDTEPGGGRLRVISPQLALDSLYTRQQAEVARRQEELTASRVAASQMIAEYTASSNESEKYAVERLVGLEAVRRRIGELVASARRETCGFSPGGPQTPENRAASRPLAEAMAERGITDRTIFLESLRNDPESVEHVRWLISLRNEVRVVPVLPMRMYIVDGEVAMVPLDPHDSSRGAAVIREPGAVAAFLALFETVWATAAPFGETQRRDLDDPGSLPRALLRLLAQGYTDEAAARKLGVSLRTERRLISDLMEQLDARSRFQLGQKAMERDLL